MNCPKNIDTFFYNTSPDDDCIDRVIPVQVLELYFSHPIHIRDSQIYWAIELADYYSCFFFSVRQPVYEYNNVRTYDATGGATAGYSIPTYDVFMAIIEPLPEWEQDQMEVLITDIVQPDPGEPGDTEGIGQTDNSQWLNVYPNPASESVTISSDTPIISLTIYDMTGRTILVQENCGTGATMNTSSLRKGIYLLYVTTTSGTATKKLVVN